MVHICYNVCIIWTTSYEKSPLSYAKITAWNCESSHNEHRLHQLGSTLMGEKVVSIGLYEIGIKCDKKKKKIEESRKREKSVKHEKC